MPRLPVQFLMERKGPEAASGNCCYRLGYCFFERLRIAEGRPKSKSRLAAEEQHPHGRSTEMDLSHTVRYLYVK